MKRCKVCEKKVDHLPGCEKCNECCARTCEEQHPDHIRRRAREELSEAIKEAYKAGVSRESAVALVCKLWDQEDLRDQV